MCAAFGIKSCIACNTGSIYARPKGNEPNRNDNRIHINTVQVLLNWIEVQCNIRMLRPIAIGRNVYTYIELLLRCFVLNINKRSALLHARENRKNIN